MTHHSNLHPINAAAAEQLAASIEATGASTFAELAATPGMARLRAAYEAAPT